MATQDSIEWPLRNEQEACFNEVCEQLKVDDSLIQHIEVGSDSLRLTADKLEDLCDSLRLSCSTNLRSIHLRNIMMQQARSANTTDHDYHSNQPPPPTFLCALKNTQHLESIELSDCQDDGSSLLDSLSIALFFNPSVASFSSTNCWHSPGCAPSLGSLFHMARFLTDIRLCHNTVCLETARCISKALVNNESLVSLDLTANKMRDDAIEVIAQGLCSNEKLQYFTLDFNAFGDRGVKALSEMLEVNAALEELHLFGNRVSAQGAEFLARGLRHNRCLTSLVLSFNQIGDRGVAALAEALTVNTTLTKMWFPSNFIGNEGMVTFARLLPQMKGLEQLDVGMLLDDEAAEALAAALRLNVRLSVLHMEKMPEDEDESRAAMDFYLRLNRGGRRLLVADDPTSVPEGLWSYLLARAASENSPSGAPDVLNFLLREKPELLDRASRRKRQ